VLILAPRLTASNRFKIFDLKTFGKNITNLIIGGIEIH